jgi:S1 RNA binding domain protein
MQIKNGEIIEGKITGITKYGAFVSIEGGMSGMIHISEVAGGFVRDINEVLRVDQIIKAVVLSVSENGRLALSIKKLPEEKTRKKPKGSFDFEDMMSKFKRESDEKMSGLKHLEPKPKRSGQSGQSRRRKDQ